MQRRDFEQYVSDVFKKEKLMDATEYGFTHVEKDQFIRIGYCTNLTPYTASEAVRQKIDLLLTHHAAWDWMHGMKASCVEELKKGCVSHYFIHLPLDDAPFGNNTTLLEKLGFTVKMPFFKENDYYCGYVGEVEEEIPLNTLIGRVESLLGESVQHWENHDKKIKRLGVVTGAGYSSDALLEAKNLECDAYLTGEKLLYTVLYAEHTKMNLIVGSHTFTELFGLEHFCRMLKTRYPSLAIIPIEAPHLESKPL